MGSFRKRRSIPNLPPAVVPVAKPLPLMGVCVFCGWASPRPDWQAVPGVMCGRPYPWESITTPDRVPAIGVYDEADPAVTKWRLAEMQKAGLDYVTYQVEWAHEHTQPTMMPSYRKRLASTLTMSHCADNHPPDSPIKYAISLWDVSAGDDLWREMKANGWKAEHVEESWRWFARTVAARYMTKPNYLHIKGKPVLFRGAADNLSFYEYTFGVTPKRIIEIIREEVRLFTGKDLYLVATATDPNFYPQLKGIGFDCKTQYLLHGGDWPRTASIYRDWWARDLAFCRAEGLDYIVPTTCGYDARAWPESEQRIETPTPAEFTAHVREAIKIAQDNADICVGLLNYAWNELGEAPSMEPKMPGMIRNGDEMIKAHRASYP